jgi:hypothetical protein
MRQRYPPLDAVGIVTQPRPDNAIMYAMPHGDDLDARFNELIAQIDEEERQRMRTAAKKGAKEPRRARPKPREDRLYAESSASWRPRRIGRLSVALITMCAVVGAAGIMVMYRPDLLGTPGATLPDEIVPALAGPPPGEAEPADAVSAAEPFKGSPAEDYADGVAGFVMPAAERLGGLSRKDVAKGLERTRDLLAAAYLDRQTLMGGKPTRYAGLLPSEMRKSFLEDLTRADTRIRRDEVNSFAPGTAELSTDVIKVRGRTTLGTFKEDGLRGAEVRLNYLIVYAVHHPGRPLTTIRLVSHFTGRVLLYRESGRLVVWPEEWGASATPASCDVNDGYVHPEYEDSAPGKVTATGAPSDPYTLDEEEDDSDTRCQASKPT